MAVGDAVEERLWADCAAHGSASALGEARVISRWQSFGEKDDHRRRYRELTGQSGKATGAEGQTVRYGLHLVQSGRLAVVVGRGRMILVDRDHRAQWRERYGPVRAFTGMLHAVVLADFRRDRPTLGRTRPRLVLHADIASSA